MPRQQQWNTEIYKASCAVVYSSTNLLKTELMITHTSQKVCSRCWTRDIDQKVRLQVHNIGLKVLPHWPKQFFCQCISAVLYSSTSSWEIHTHDYPCARPGILGSHVLIILKTSARVYYCRWYLTYIYKRTHKPIETAVRWWKQDR